MKKVILTLCCIIALTSCTSPKKETTTTKLKVGATATPAGEILEFAKPLLKEKGIDLEIIIYSDYIIPNKALHNKDIDANMFQHLPFLEKQSQESKYDLVSVGNIYIPPIGLYSKKIKDIKDLKNGSKILISSSVTDHGRVLSILEEAKLITLKKGVDKTKATLDDIESNPKKLVFDAQYEASLLPKIFESGEGDAAFINTNFALANNIDLNSAILKEGSESKYVNIVATRTENKDDKNIKTLVEVLKSKEVKAFILEKFKGGIIPAE